MNAPTCTMCGHPESDHRRNGACMVTVSLDPRSVCPCNGPDHDHLVGNWLLTLTCCGRENGYQVCPSWEAAEEFRNYYLDALGHDRSAVLTEMAYVARCGFHQVRPDLDEAGPGSSAH